MIVESPHIEGGSYWRKKQKEQFYIYFYMYWTVYITQFKIFFYTTRTFTKKQFRTSHKLLLLVRNVWGKLTLLWKTNLDEWKTHVGYKNMDEESSIWSKNLYHCTISNQQIVECNKDVCLWYVCGVHIENKQRKWRNGKI